MQLLKQDIRIILNCLGTLEFIIKLHIPLYFVLYELFHLLLIVFFRLNRRRYRTFFFSMLQLCFRFLTKGQRLAFIFI